MSANEHETLIEAQEEADRQAIAAVEAAVLEVIKATRPESLQELSRNLADADLGEVDRGLLRVAIWLLLHTKRLELTDDRRLAAAG